VSCSFLGGNATFYVNLSSSNPESNPPIIVESLMAGMALDNTNPVMIINLAEPGLIYC